ncbi:MAG: hypothetical protein AAFQ89_24155 [Cyanobacteria bacterium J06626_18]
MVKKLLIAIVVFSAAIGGGLAYAWNRATAVPRWYAADTAVPNATVSVSDLLAQRATTTGGQVQVTLSEADLNQIAASAAANSSAASILEATGGISTRIDRDRIESGTVVNFSELPMDALPAEGQAAINQLQDRFPVIANRDVYIGLSSQPQVRDGQLRFGDDASIKIGQMSIPLGDAAQQLGLSQAELEAQLSALLTQQGIRLEDVRVVDGQLLLSGSQQP